MPDVFNWLLHLHIGKWITDNTATLGSFCAAIGSFFTFLTMLLKWHSDNKEKKRLRVEKRKDNIVNAQTQETIMRKIDANTAVTVATAEKAGIPMDMLLKHIDDGFDDILKRKANANAGKHNERADDERMGGPGNREHH